MLEEISQFFASVPLYNLLLSLLLGYMLGSIPTAVWLGKWFFGKDVREFGSKNAGATNTYRVLGKNAALAVLLIDVLKGFAAVSLVPSLYQTTSFGLYGTLLMILSGIAAVTGHVYPVFAQFKGGKGVATALGMVLALNPQVAGLSLLVFLLFFIPTGYVSLGSMMAALSFPLFMVFKVFGPESGVLIGFGFCLFVFEVYTHRANVKRLMAGTENKIRFGAKKDKV